jgi:signal transduction histidine kinase
VAPEEAQNYEPMMDRAARPGKSGMKLVLMAGFGAVLALMAVGAIDSIRANRGIELGNAKLIQSYVERHHSLERIRSTLYFSGTLVRDYLLESDPTAAEAQLNALRNVRGEMTTALKEYSIALGPEERDLFLELEKQVTAYWSELAPIFRWSAEERRGRGYEFLQTQILPRRTMMVGIADQIDAVSEKALVAGNRRSAELFNSFRRRILIMLALMLAVGLLVAGFSIAQILRLEKEARLRYQEIARARAELRELSAKLVDAQEQERRSISRELHDEVGQALSAVLVEIGNLTVITPEDNHEARRLLSTTKKLAEESMNAVRNLSLLLRPSMLDDFGLVPALHWQAREVSRRTGMRVHVAAENVSDELPEEHKTCIYRVVQEALHNCSRHADAHNVKIAADQEENRILLSVKDDGKGFDPYHVRGLGLIGMEERVKHLGGVFHVESRPGSGTLLKIELPLVQTASKAVEISV